MRLRVPRVPSTRRSLSLVLAGVVCLAGWQAWLTWRLMEQDRSLEQQRFRERLEQTAGLAAAQVARSVGDWDLGLRKLARFVMNETRSEKLFLAFTGSCALLAGIGSLFYLMIALNSLIMIQRPSANPRQRCGWKPVLRRRTWTAT